MSAYDAAVQFVRTRIKEAGVDAEVYEGLAHESATYPLITISTQSEPVDVNYTGERAMTRVELMVRAWDNTPSSVGGDSRPVQLIVDAIDAALHLAPPVDTAYGAIRSCVRYAETLPITVEENGFIKRGRGGRYRVEVSPLP